MSDTPDMPPQGATEASPSDAPGAAPPKPGRRRRRLGTHLFLFSCIIMVAAFLGWANYGRLDVVALASGDVVPATQVKAVQHLEGGIIRKILVREGDKVKHDQALVQMEPITNRAGVAELEIRLRTLRVSTARLEAESAAAQKTDFPEDLRTSHPTLVRRARDLFEIRKSRVDNQIRSQVEQIKQRTHEINEVQVRLRNSSNSMKILREQLKINRKLLRLDLSNRMTHLNLQKEEAELLGKITEDRAALPRARAALAAARAQLEAVKNGFQEEARKELAEVRRTEKELRQRLRTFRDSLRRTVLRAPVAGTVKSLYVVTEGGVIQPGGTVLDIVPGDDRLVVEARLQTQDIGYVRPDQDALIQLASAEAARYGTLIGNVVHVSPDAIVTREGVPFYKVRIEPERDHFKRGDLRYQLSPGMQVQVSIRTGTRTVMRYLLDPYIGSLGLALRER